ncbi:MAG: DUF1631 family protein [Burkholderiaceae bacterium]
MDRKDLLASTRTEFLRAFQDAIDDLILLSVEHLFNKADHSHSSVIQGRFLDARGVLIARGASLRQPLMTNMEQLLYRSFQTAYNTFRPSFSTAQQGGGLALLDSSAFEDELRIDILTSRFRNEAEEQLRDLNIRVALLFEQDNIKERENPFRPYLLSRCIATVVEAMGLSAELISILTEQLAEALLSKVAGLYDRVNAHLAQHGIAAQLQLKIKKFPLQSPISSTASPRDDAPQNPASDNPAASGGGNAAFGKRAQPTPADSAKGKVDQLMQLVQSRAFASAEGQADSAATAMASAPAGAAKSGWLGGTHIVGDALRKFFSGVAGSDMGAEADNPNWHSDQAAASAATQGRVHLVGSIHKLVKNSTPLSDDMLGADGEVRNLILEQRSSLNEITGDASEQMTIDIVAMLFEFILRDNAVPAEVRAQLGRLQFLVLKIAMLDPALLTRKSHPARMLVNRIGSISLGLKQIDPSGVRVTAEICRIVETLLDDVTEDAYLFSKMLDEFDEFITRELLANDVQVERAVHIIEKAENRTLHFARTTARIDEVLNGLDVDPHLHQFLVNAWSHAIERAERTDMDGARRFRSLIPQLLWSIQPKVGGSDRASLLALLPTMLPVLREGMALAGWSVEQQQELLSWLVDAHAGAMRAHHFAKPSMTLSAVQALFQELVDNPEAEPQRPIAHGKADFDSQFLDEAIKELEAQLHKIDEIYDLGVDKSPQDEIPEASSDASLPAEDTTETEQAILAQLRSGVAVEINLGGTPGRGRLNWVSPSISNLVLSIEGQDVPSIISVRLFRRLLANGRARFLETAPLFERAVESLLLSADQVDGARA